MGIHTSFSPDAFRVTGPESAQAILRRDQERWKKVRGEIIATIPSNEEGVNVRRVEDFFTELGLTVADYLIISNEDARRTTDILAAHQYYYLPFLEKIPWLGLCLNDIGIVLVTNTRLRYEAFETEQFLVHELGHGTSRYTVATAHRGTSTVIRSGFMTSSPHDSCARNGDFLEEGFVELLVGKYTQRYMPHDVREVLAHTVAQRTGVANSADVCEICSFTDAPLKYYTPDHDGHLWLRYTTLAGYSIELLCHESPELFPALIAARHDLSALRRVAQIIDHVSPGLYVRLRKLAYNEADFKRGLAMVQEAIAQKVSVQAA